METPGPDRIEVKPCGSSYEFSSSMQSITEDLITLRLKKQMVLTLDSMVLKAFGESSAAQAHPRLFWNFARMSETGFRFGRALRSAWRAFRSEWTGEDEYDY